jgi:hypothetical protein
VREGIFYGGIAPVVLRDLDDSPSCDDQQKSKDEIQKRLCKATSMWNWPEVYLMNGKDLISRKCSDSQQSL